MPSWIQSFVVIVSRLEYAQSELSHCNIFQNHIVTVSHDFCAFTCFFPAPCAANVVINDPLFIACDNYFKERLIFVVYQQRNCGVYTIKNILLPQRMGTHVQSLLTNPRHFKCRMTLEIWIFKHFLFRWNPRFILHNVKRNVFIDFGRSLGADWSFKLTSRW